MSCNCGCHDDKVPATGWRKYAPMILGVAIVAVLIAATVFKNDGTKTASEGRARATAAAPPE